MCFRSRSQIPQTHLPHQELPFCMFSVTLVKPEKPLILYDSWYTKQNLVSLVDEYPNLELIGNARIDSVMYDPAPAHTGRR